ncbi:MAG: glycosyltransferase [Myxococcales bacterium]|nr:glycosyltransferase [Myxococcales bacterium]MCB9526268.1 glycosyltransferase [Myxococcales bacterium]
MARILFAQPSLQPPGGGNGVAAWMLQALLEVGHTVHLLTWWPYAPEAVDDFYGTHLTGRPLASVRQAPVPLRALDHLPARLDLLRNALFMRVTAQAERGMDLVVSCNNEWPGTKPGLNYVHYPARARPRPAADRHAWYHNDLMLQGYYAVADGVGGFDGQALAGKRVLANSQWTAARFQALHGRAAHVLHPPVAGEFQAVPWAERRAEVLSVGRFSPEKRFEAVIDVVAQARALGADLSLRLVGSGGDSAYRRQVEARAAEQPWITVEANLPRADLLDRMAHARFGLHAMVDEHFGMAPAELVRAGCVTLVHRSGGAQEIVAHPELAWPDEATGAATLAALATDPARCDALRAHLADRRGRFGVPAFTQAFLGHVHAALEGRA